MYVRTQKYVQIFTIFIENYKIQIRYTITIETLYCKNIDFYTVIILRTKIVEHSALNDFKIFIF